MLAIITTANTASKTPMTAPAMVPKGNNEVMSKREIWKE